MTDQPNEQDRHEELMARGGLYAEMYQRQFQMDDSAFPSGGIGGGIPHAPNGDSPV